MQRHFTLESIWDVLVWVASYAKGKVGHVKGVERVVMAAREDVE